MPQEVDGRSQLWRFGRHRLGAQPEIDVRRPATAVVYDVFALGERCSRSAATVVAVPAAVVDAGQPSRQPIERCRHLSSNGRDGHVVCHEGGARIAGACPREKVCRMAMAWPQCQHTNVGRWIPGSPPSGGLAARAGWHNNSSTSVKLALRQPLASSP